MSAPFGGGRRLLIADDDAAIRLMLVAFLRRFGFQLRQARDGREALDEMRKGNFDLMIMDLMMPNVSGWDVLRERERDRSLLRIPIIVITAMSTNQAFAGIGDRHVAAVLGKPFDLATLLAAVRTSIGHAGLPEPVAA